MTRPTHDAVPDRLPRPDAPPHAEHGATVATEADLALEDALVRAAGEAVAAALPSDDPALPRLHDWLAEEARLARTPGERRRDARCAARFAAAMAGRCDLARAARRVPPPEPGRAEERTVAARPLADAVARAAAERAAPLLDLRVAAGDGRLLWEQACDRWVALPPGVPAGRHVALGVAGDSMRPLLQPGDTLLVRLDAEPAVGALVVARVAGDGYVVKQVGALTAATIELRSLNPAYRPRRVQRRPGAVLGVVVAWWGARRGCPRLSSPCMSRTTTRHRHLGPPAPRLAEDRMHHPTSPITPAVARRRRLGAVATVATVARAAAIAGVADPATYVADSTAPAAAPAATPPSMALSLTVHSEDRRDRQADGGARLERVRTVRFAWSAR